MKVRVQYQTVRAKLVVTHALKKTDSSATSACSRRCFNGTFSVLTPTPILPQDLIVGYIFISLLNGSKTVQEIL